MARLSARAGAGTREATSQPVEGTTQSKARCPLHTRTTGPAQDHAQQHRKHVPCHSASQLLSLYWMSSNKQRWIHVRATQRLSPSLHNKKDATQSSSSSTLARFGWRELSSCNPNPLLDDELWSTSVKNLSTLKGSMPPSFSN